MPPSHEVLKAYMSAVEEHNKVVEKLQAVRKREKQLSATLDESNELIASLSTYGEQLATVIQVIDANNVLVRLVAGPRYLVNRRSAINPRSIKPGSRVSLCLSTLSIMHVLPPQMDESVYAMSDSNADGNSEDAKLTYANVGGLQEEIKLIKEAIELPLRSPELFARVGIKPPKSILLYGAPGTGKSLICKCLANSLQISYVKCVGSQLVRKYIGESAAIIRDLFSYAREKSPCLLMIDEVDAIASKRSDDGSSLDREIDRALLQLLTEIDGFTALDAGVKVVFCTNRPECLDPALLRPGRCDVKIEIRIPDSTARYEILKIHSEGMTLGGDVDLGAIVKVTDGFNGADLRNVMTEAGLSALRALRSEVLQEDLLHAASIVRKNKALESSAHSYMMKGHNAR
ncbi:26S protease regulatory subunit 7 [Giardia muris]|uniref:26S protease regulatory subunit 7 n=1 Tax=Giardia muris TaxID=5742 RepID=A0A4Z1SN10_GIAMU|nr:26S protease regulatory subunit 7 [Giardia muris]|eukprot:TNJ27122.1 26S protease regulatory subunit 7 [Giardia muris]